MFDSYWRWFDGGGCGLFLLSVRAEAYKTYYDQFSNI